jgi:predicted nucleotidyltransferase
MFSKQDIIAKGWLVKEIVDLILFDDLLSVDKIFLIGSYASGKETAWSDIDFLIQLKGGKQIGLLFPSWNKIQEMNTKINNKRIHLIFGTEESAESLHEKHKNDIKNYAYKKLNLEEIQNANSHKSVLSQ